MNKPSILTAGDYVEVLVSGTWQPIQVESIEYVVGLACGSPSYGIPLPMVDWDLVPKHIIVTGADDAPIQGNRLRPIGDKAK